MPLDADSSSLTCMPDRFATIPSDAPALPAFERIAHVDDWFESIGARVAHGGAQAFYAASEDRIELPPFESFHDADGYYTTRGHPRVETAPIPAGAQFLNVIESVFSGMARAIIHNSNYPSVTPCTPQSTVILPTATSSSAIIPSALASASGAKSSCRRSSPIATTARILVGDDVTGDSE